MTASLAFYPSPLLNKTCNDKAPVKPHTEQIFAGQPSILIYTQVLQPQQLQVPCFSNVSMIIRVSFEQRKRCSVDDSSD